MDITFIDWPLYPSDINLIESAWYFLKKVLEMQTEFEHITRNQKRAFKDEIILYLNLVKSMARRVETYYKAKSWHTKY
jgi:hypothetical protein